MHRDWKKQRRARILKAVQTAMIIAGTILLTMAWAAGLFFFGLDGAAFLITENILMSMLGGATAGMWLLVMAVNMDKEID